MRSWRIRINAASAAKQRIAISTRQRLNLNEECLEIENRLIQPDPTARPPNLTRIPNRLPIVRKPDALCNRDLMPLEEMARIMHYRIFFPMCM